MSESIRTEHHVMLDGLKHTAYSIQHTFQSHRNKQGRKTFT